MLIVLVVGSAPRSGAGGDKGQLPVSPLCPWGQLELGVNWAVCWMFGEHLSCPRGWGGWRGGVGSLLGESDRALCLQDAGIMGTAWDEV